MSMDNAENKMFTNELRSKINIADEGVHQAILNVAYDDWQAAEGWSLADMIENTSAKYGELAALAVQVGKYNQQVTNGGHFQYWDNGYASAKTNGCFANHNEAELHLNMISLFEKYGMQHLANGDKVLELMNEFAKIAFEPGTCYDCDGSGGDIDEDGEWEDCYSCGGSGKDDRMIGDTDHLDTAYYAIYDDWMDEVESFLATRLNA